MSSLNQVQLIGNLGRDPETRRTNAGNPVVSFSIATSETWRDKASGERREAVEWHNIVVFNENIAKVAEQYLRKGHKVYVQGQLQHRKYTDKDGVERRATEVVLKAFDAKLVLLERADRPAPSESDYGHQRVSAIDGTRSPPAGSGRPAPDLDDDIPF
jgi:single-strand DNA-binding protein